MNHAVFNHPMDAGLEWRLQNPRKAAATREVLNLNKSVRAVAQKYGVSNTTIRNWLDRSQGI